MRKYLIYILDILMSEFYNKSKGKEKETNPYIRII